MSRPTDSQRSKLYAAENRAEAQTFAAGLWEPLDGSLEAAQAFAERVVRSRWWKANASANQRSAALHLTIERGDRGHGGGWARGRHIKLGAKPRRHVKAGVVAPSPIASPPIILHELAHVGTPSGTGHGSEFARLLLGLLRRFVSPEVADAYRASFREGKVRHRVVGHRQGQPGNVAALAAFIPTSDGEWIIGCEVQPPERGGRTVAGVTLYAGQGAHQAYVRNYGTDRGLERLATTREKARVWKNRATADRWLERFAREEGSWAHGWQVEARLPEALVACDES